MGETTQILRRIRHWKTTLTGVALIASPLALSIWPDQAALIAKITVALTGAGFIAAADSKPTEVQNPKP